MVNQHGYEQLLNVFPVSLKKNIYKPLNKETCKTSGKNDAVYTP